MTGTQPRGDQTLCLRFAQCASGREEGMLTPRKVRPSPRGAQKFPGDWMWRGSLHSYPATGIGVG